MSCAPRVLVVGEVLVDAVRAEDGTVTEHVGGSPASVAVGLARLGHDVDFATAVGDDSRGLRCLSHLAAGGVNVLGESRHAGPTSVAEAVLDASGAAAYLFELRWELTPVTPAPGTVHVHTGSIAATLEPGQAEVTAVLRSARERASVSYDPNMRPTIMGDPDEVRRRVEELVALSDVVKASDDDLAFLYAGRPPEAVLAEWAALGPGLAVVTLGAAGVVYRASGTGEIGEAPAAPGAVVDTVGAGDSFMAGLVSGLLDAGLLGGPQARSRLARASLADVTPAIGRALATSGITVGHAGAYAPDRAEVGADGPEGLTEERKRTT